MRTRASGLFRAKSCVRANQQLVELSLKAGVPAEQRSQPCSQKSEWNAHNGRVLQRKPCFGLNQMPHRARHIGRINRHHGRAYQDQSD